MTVANQIHPSVRARFGSSSAKPRAIRGYTAASGWVVFRKGRILTPDIVQSLKDDGYTMIEARWHLQVKQISLAQLA